MNNSNEHKYWEVYRRGHERNRYYYRSQVNPKNVSQLKVAWTFFSLDEKRGLGFIFNKMCKSTIIKAIWKRDVNLLRI